MTADDFVARYRAPFLGLFAEVYAMRKLTPGSFGMLMDGQYAKLEILLRQIHRDLDQPLPVGGNNGKAKMVSEALAKMVK